MFGREHYKAVERMIARSEKYPDKTERAKLIGAIAVEDDHIAILKDVLHLQSYELLVATNQAVCLENNEMLAFLYAAALHGIKTSQASFYKHKSNDHIGGKFFLPQGAIDAEIAEEEYTAVYATIRSATVDKTV